MKEYLQYIRDVRTGKVKTSQYIKQAVERLEDFKQRPDMYFDEAEVQKCFDFCATFTEWQGAAAGLSGALLPFQKWIVGSIVGIKWKDTGLRVCRDVFMLVARKNAKTSLIAKLSLYLLIADGEASPYVGCVASSRQQARILFEAAQHYLHTIDPKEKTVKQFRNYIQMPANSGEFHVFSSDSSNMDGYNFSTAICDEVHSYKDNSLISVLRSSMGARKQPLLFQITTAGFLLEGYPCYETWKVSVEILAGVKQDDTFFPFLYVMDPDDDWEDEDNWIKCNPSLDTIVSRQYLRDQLNLAKNDSTQQVAIKTKNFNLWCSAASVWIRQEDVAACMKEKLNLEDFAGSPCYLAVDLASVGDTTALTALIPKGGKFYFKSWGFIPHDTFVDSPNHELYQRFYNDGDLLITPGNITDYQFITNKIVEISQIMPIVSIQYDKYNSSQWAIQCTDLGFNLEQFAQGLLSFNAPTKELERLILSKDAVIDKSSFVLWCFMNAILMVDHAGNVKPTKSGANQKIDAVITCIQALGGYLKKPTDDDYEIFVI